MAHHAGVTLVQSIGGRLAVGTTLKVRARHRVASQPAGGDATTCRVNAKFDADLGVMATGSLGQLGLSVRNLLQPEFKTGDGAVRLERRVRAGVSIHAGRTTTVAADLDFTTAHDPEGGVAGRGDGRRDAPGPESLAAGRGSLEYDGKRRSRGSPIGSVGGSYAVYGLGHGGCAGQFGSRDGDRGWGVGLRFVFLGATNLTI